MTKEETASKLGVSLRTLQRIMNAGQIKYAQHRNQRGGIVLVFESAEVERVRKERAQDIVVHPSVALEKPHQRSAIAKRDQFGELAQVLMQAIQQKDTARRPLAITVSLDSKLWLTRRECAALSGLPLSEIVQAIKDGKLPAKKHGAGWRVKRQDLERWAS
jgi:excisionase family DNA binding protein